MERGENDYYSDEESFPHSSYFEGQRLDILKFYSDLGFVYENPAIVEIACEQIIKDTEKIDTVIASNANLRECSAFLLKKGYVFDDPSMAQQITTLRILKEIPAIYGQLTQLRNVREDMVIETLRADIYSRITDYTDEGYLREQVITKNGAKLTLEQFKKGYGVYRNKNKLISEREMGQVILPSVVEIFREYIYNIKDNIERR